MTQTLNSKLQEQVSFASPEAIEAALARGELQQVTLGLGCFWGPDSSLAATDGVVQTRVGYAGSQSLAPTYHDLGEHAEVVRVVFDPTSNALHKLLSVVVSWLPPRAERTGQYRNLISVGHTSQAAHVEEILKTVDALARPEVLLPGEPRSRFWPAEDYHQKHRLRRNKGLVTILEEEFGMRWDEHLFVTKLNAGGTRGFDLAPWLAKVSVRVATAYRKGA